MFEPEVVEGTTLANHEIGLHATPTVNGRQPARVLQSLLSGYGEASLPREGGYTSIEESIKAAIELANTDLGFNVPDRYQPGSTHVVSITYAMSITADRVCVVASGTAVQL